MLESTPKLAMFLLFLPAPLHCADVPPKRPQQAVELIAHSRALPPEFSADTLLRLATSRLVTDKKWQEELIDEAYWSGGRAPLPYQQWADRKDSLPTREVRANHLESLTLRARAIEAMLLLDSSRALRMFEEIGPLSVADPNCSDVLTADVTAYYKTASAVFERAFNPRQKREEEDLNFLKRLITGIQTPSQVAPALQMILGVKLTSEKRIDLLNTFAGMLDRVSGSDRSFGATEATLVPAPSPELATAPIFVAALRNYILRHVRSRRCTDNIPPPGQVSKSVTQFNELILKLDPTSERFKTIPVADTTPLGDAGSYRAQPLWRSTRARSVLAALQWLHHGDREPAQDHLFTVEERSTDEWIQHFQETLKLLDGWKPLDEDSPNEYLCMLTDALSDLAALAPPGRMRDTAMSTYIEALEETYASVENRNLWFTQFRQMLYRARYSNDPQDKAWILNAMSRSKNPIIVIYAKLEALDIAP
jgi:truncated hemoglobin YjbI